MRCCYKKRIKKIKNFGYSESNVHFDQKIEVGNNLDKTDEFIKRRNSSKIAEEEFIEDKNSIKIGLDNIDAIYYKNATLQYLSNKKDINNCFFKKNKYKKNDKNKKLSNEFYIIIKNLWDKKRNNKSYSPNEFKKTISEMNYLFEGVQANDSKDLINFLLEQLQIELNIISEKINNNENNATMNIQTNKNKLYELFLNNYKTNYNSIISDSFYGSIQTQSICQNYRIVKYNYEIVSFCEFPLEQINIYFGKTPFNINYELVQPEIKLNECFNFYQKGEIMTKDNAMYCDLCNITWDSFYITKIYKPPKYLILILNWGIGNIYKCNVKFSEILDLKSFVENKNCNTLYDLYAVICHFRPSSMGGHFIVYARNALNDKCYCYNDSSVTLFKEKNYLTDVPYILFYQEIVV